MENSICLFATIAFWYFDPNAIFNILASTLAKIYKFANQTNRMRISYSSSTPFFGTEVVKEAFRDSKNSKGKNPL